MREIYNKSPEDRLAQVLLEYVAASGRVRLAELEFHAASAGGGAELAAKKWRKAVLEQRATRRSLAVAEDRFRANGGWIGAVTARLEAAFLQAPSRAA